jgi:predicted nucleic acid-binding Zn ribbon protein
VQSCWARAVGDAIVDQAEPVAERDGTVTVACRSATWAQELDLMQDAVRKRLNAALAEHGAESDAPIKVTQLRFTADASRHGRLG